MRLRRVAVQFIGVVALLQLCVLVLLRFRGSYHGFYINALPFYQNPSHFSHDIFLNNTLLFDSTIYYPILAFFGITWGSDFQLLALSLFLITINIKIYIDFIRDYYSAGDWYVVGLYLLPALVLGNFLAPNAESALIYSHTGTASQVAFTAILLMVFYAIRQRWVISSTFAVLSLLLSVKHSAFPVFVTCTYAMCSVFGVRSLAKWYVLIIIGLAISTHMYFIYLPNSLSLEKVELIDFIILRDQHEDAWHLQSVRGLIKLSLGFGALFLSLKSISNAHLKSYLQVLLASSILAVVFGWTYTSFLYKLYPEPYVVLLSTVKAMFLMQFFACAGLTKLILDRCMCHPSKALFLAALFFGSFGGQTGENLALALVGLGWVWSVVAKRYLPVGAIDQNWLRFISFWQLGSARNLTVAAAVLAITFPLSAHTLNNKLKSYSPYHSGRFTIVGTDKKFLLEAESLRNCGDFNFLPVDEYYFFKNIASGDLQNIVNPFLIFYAEKSNFLGDPAHFYLNLEMQRIYIQRKKNVAEIFDLEASIEDRNLAWDKLADSNVVILGRNDLLSDYMSSKTTFLSGSYVYIFPGGHEQRAKFSSNCRLYEKKANHLS